MNVFILIKQTTLGLLSAMMTCRLQNLNSIIKLFHCNTCTLVSIFQAAYMAEGTSLYLHHVPQNAIRYSGVVYD